MKNLLLLILFAFSLFYSETTVAQIYHENDKDGLRAFLRQPSADPGVLNLELAGLSVSDTLSWNLSEEWVNNLTNPDGYPACTWNIDQPKRLLHLNFSNSGTSKLAGKLDCRPFERLTALYGTGNQLTEIDVSNNRELQDIKCADNLLSGTIDLSNRPNLYYIDFGDNQLEGINASNCPHLEALICYRNQLTSMNVQGSPLTFLHCIQNRLTEVSVPDGSRLIRLYCYGNQIANLNLSNMPVLEELECAGNALQTLDVSGKSKLRNVHCGNNRLASINLSNTPKLTYFSCGENLLTGTIDLSNRPELVYVQAHNNQLQGLNLSNCPKLDELICIQNQLTSLNLQGTPSIRYVQCMLNQLSELDLSNRPKLTHVYSNGNQLTHLDISGVPQLEEMECAGNLLQTLDVSGKSKLRNVHCGNNRLTSINLSNTPKLTYFSCGENLLTGTIDLSNRPELEEVQAHNNQLTSLNLQGTPSLRYVQCTQNQLSELSLSSHPGLIHIYCNGNRLSELDLSGVPLLEELECAGNLLQTLDVSGKSKLRKLHCGNNRLLNLNVTESPLITELGCQNNRLTFATLPVGPYNYYPYIPQDTIRGGEVPANTPIDLSDQAIINGNVTNFQWYDQSGNPIYPETDTLGKFIPGRAWENQRLFCFMTNATFPGLTLMYIVNITEAPSIVLTNHLALVQSPQQDYYMAQPGQTFKVQAPYNGDPDLLRIGLYKTNGTWVEDLTVSRNNDVYTCQVTWSLPGNYMIQPYRLEAGAAYLVERPENSYLIDKLPFAVISSSGYSSLISEELLSSHLVLNSSQKNFYGVYIDIPFKVVVNVPNTSEVRMGLFDLQGNLVEDITQSVTGKIYTCLISYNVYPDNYVIMPYKMYAPPQVIWVERPAGTQLMDRLPVAVDYDWGFRSATGIDENQLSVEISVSPNPVKDILRVNASEPIKKITIYGIGGNVIKEETDVDCINMGTFPAGIYIIKVITPSGESVFKTIKKD